MNKQSLLPIGWKIPVELRERLGDQPGRQRKMLADGHLLLVLHAPPAADQDERCGRYFWRQPDGTWSATGGPGGPAALSALLDEYEAAIDKLQRAEEAAQSSRDYFELLSQLTPLMRATRNLYATLQDARQAVPEERRLIVARDRGYGLSRQAELLEADARNALDFVLAQRAEEQAASSFQMSVAAHRLNLLVAFFFPIATLTAVFGMNLGHGLENFDASVAPIPLLGVLAAGLFLGGVLTTFVTSRAVPKSRDTSTVEPNKN